MLKMKKKDTLKIRIMFIEVSSDLKKKLEQINNNFTRFIFSDISEDNLAPNHIVSLSSFSGEDNPNGYISFIKKDGSTGDIKLGRILKHILNKSFLSQSPIPSSSIEFAHNKFVTLCNKHVFEIIESPNVSYWYDQENYYGRGDEEEYDKIGSLWKSCMRGYMYKCGDWYDQNPSIKMLAKFKDGKLIGRALLWHGVKSKKDQSIEFNFMDRIYTVADSDIQAFKDWAKENGYWTKRFQSYDTMHEFNDLDGNSVTINDAYVKIEKPYAGDGKPYLDTFLYINSDNTVSNNITRYSCFEARDPEADEMSLNEDRYKDTDEYYCSQFMVYCPVSSWHVFKEEASWLDSRQHWIYKDAASIVDGEYCHPDDVVFSPYYNKDIIQDENVVFSNKFNSPIKIDDCYFVEGDWIPRERCMWSHAQMSYIYLENRQSIKPVSDSILRTQNTYLKRDYVDYDVYSFFKAAYPCHNITTDFIKSIVSYSFGHEMQITNKVLNGSLKHKFTPPLFLFTDGDVSRIFNDHYKYEPTATKIALDWIRIEKPIDEFGIINKFLALAKDYGYNVESVGEINNLLILE